MEEMKVKEYGWLASYTYRTKKPLAIAFSRMRLGLHGGDGGDYLNNVQCKALLYLDKK
jgi:hypothetical protein